MKKLFLSGLISVFLISLLPAKAIAVSPTNNAESLTNRIIVKFKNQSKFTTQAQMQLENNSLKKISLLGKTRLKSKSSYSLEIENNKLNDSILKLKQDKNVEFVEKDYVARATEIPDDPEFYKQWNMENVYADLAWYQTHSSPSVKIAVLDTGIDPTHPDLQEKIVAKKNFTTSPDGDAYGHGTHVAGIAAAITNNNTGVAGVAPDASLMDVKVLGDDGGGYYSWISDGIRWAADNGANIINMSLGSTGSSAELEDAINYAWSKGVVVVAAAGNNGNDTPFYPAYVPNVIAVGATYSNNSLASFSNYGDWVDVAAPGDFIYSTYKGSSYTYLSGTSMASPMVAGLAGLIYGQHPQWNNQQVREKIESTTDSLSTPPFTGIFGRINACRALDNCYLDTPRIPVPELGDGVSGSYFSNKNLTGTARTKIDPSVDFNWGLNAPYATSFPRDYFSIRWVGKVLVPKYSGDYTFYTYTDDGARLWINDQLVIDKWKGQPATEYSTTLRLHGSVKYNIKMEYFDNTGNALAQLSWSGPGISKTIIPQKDLFSEVITPTPTVTVAPTETPTPTIITPTPTLNPGQGDGLTGYYYKDTNLNYLGLTRKDDNINFIWSGNSPVQGFSNYNFSVRWMGQILSHESGDYTFYARSDDGIRLWIDDNLIIDKWVAGNTEYKGTVNLIGGKKYNIKVEYFQNWGGAIMQLYWSGPGLAKQIIPQTQLYSNQPTPSVTQAPTVTPTVSPSVAPTASPTVTPTISPIPYGLKGDYFSDKNMANLVLSRIDPAINFELRGVAPAPQMPIYNYSIRWTGFVVPPQNGSYTLYTNVDDGVRLYIDNVLLIDHWTPQTKEFSTLVAFEKGKRYQVKIEYFQEWGNAIVKLLWDGPGISKQIIPPEYLFSN